MSMQAVYMQSRVLGHSFALKDRVHGPCTRHHKSGLLAFAIEICSPHSWRRDSLATIRLIAGSVLHLASKRRIQSRSQHVGCVVVTPLVQFACDDRAELCAGVQVPTGGESASPADQALYDAVARALLGERADAQAPGLGAQLLPPEQLPRMLHYLLGTQLRRHLERWAYMHANDGHGHANLR